MSIDKEILYTLIRHRVQDEAVLDLTRRILRHDCTKNFVYKGDPGLLAKVPRTRRCSMLRGTGLPIGNLTSQFFANVYLNELDSMSNMP